MREKSRWSKLGALAAALGCWPALAQTSSGTAAVAIWTSGEAVLATDSKVTLTNGDAVLPAEQTCKIRTAGRFYFALAGLYNHVPTQFDAWRLAESAIAGATSVADAASRAERSIRPALQVALTDIERRDPQGYRVRRAQAWLVIWVAGTERGNPVMAGREFFPGRSVPHEFPGARGDGATGEVGISIFGERSAIDAAYSDVEAIGKLVRAKGPVAAAEELVELEIAGEPDKVGKPVAMVRITTMRTSTGGPEWLTRGLCPAPR